MQHAMCLRFRWSWPGMLSLLALTVFVGGSRTACGQPATVGQWSAPFNLQNVAIHTNVLPDGRVLYWGRREVGEGMDPHNCTPRIWDPATGAITTTPQPGFNLFCAGHTFLGDGRLFCVGGHWLDGEGVKNTTIYDWRNNTWTATGDTNDNRWYPTAVTLPDGGVLVVSGAVRNGVQNNPNSQVWENGTWRTIVDFQGLPLYPRMHVANNGQVFMSGPLAFTQYLKTSVTSQWTPLGDRNFQFRDYAPAVMYAPGKVLYAGGGNPPEKGAEVIDLNAATPAWSDPDANDMHFARRQHNGTVLPDGTVLVTGGTQGNGGPNNGFNDLNIGSPIRAAEVWDPATKAWTILAEESVDRCYHSTAVLLPDGRVLSAGGGEYKPDNVNPNPPANTHRNAQIFSPPYLFRGTRPTITSAPGDVGYGAMFDVGTPTPAAVAQVTWVRLGSVTHSLDTNQRINLLAFTAGTTNVHVTAPASRNECPPGYYMLFILNAAKVPSVSRIIRIH